MRPTNSDAKSSSISPIAEGAIRILQALGITSEFAPNFALNLEPNLAPNVAVPVIAVVGAGGKSTTTFSVATALAKQGRRVVVSTTTKMGHDQTGGLPTTPPNIEAVARALTGPGVCLVVEHPDPNSPKVVGPSTVWFDELCVSGLVDAIVLEADGARRRNAKAPGPNEPVLPASTTHVLAILGSDALDRVIEDQGHRPMRIAAAAGCGPYDRLTPQRAARLMTSDIGGRKGVTGAMGFCAVVTKVADDNQANAELTATFVRDAGFGIVLVPFDLQAGSVVRPELPAELGT
jgi:probable selenium-dependent hydroxylase accessory protein YqeC